jgi:uncharacterized membrane protein YoaK (UPF0700 family)
MFAATHHSTEDLLQVLVFLLILACLGGAACLVYLKNFVGAGLMVVVAVVVYLLLL